MKSIQSFRALLLVSLICGAFAGRAQQLTIIEQNYEQAKAESLKQNKLLLIDFYTTWCAPCKVIDEVIFKNPLVSKEIAKQFVLLKYDAEKDKEHQLTLKHHVGMYPTAIVLNRGQLVLHKLIGIGGSEKDLVKNYKAFLDEAVAKDLKSDYIKGVSSQVRLAYPKFYEDYIYRVDTKQIDDKLALYWENNSDYFSEVSFAVLSYFVGGPEKVNTFFLEHKSKYEALYGKLDVDFILLMMINSKVYKAIGKKDRTAFNEGIKLAKANLEAKDTANFVRVAEEKMLQAENRWPEALKMFEARKEGNKLDNESVTYFCETVSQKCSDVPVLQKCSAWMKKISTSQPNLENLDLYARLLAKSGDKKLALQTMEKAIKIGRANKEDVKSNEEWLKKNSL